MASSAIFTSKERLSSESEVAPIVPIARERPRVTPVTVCPPARRYDRLIQFEEMADLAQSVLVATPVTGEPSLDLNAWLQERVIQILKARTATGNRVAHELKCEPYFGRSARMWGYFLCFEHRHSFFNFQRRFLMLKRSHYSTEYPTTRPPLDDLIRELETQVVAIPPESFGAYHERLDTPGTYAKVECQGLAGRFFYKISESGNMQPFNYEGLRRGSRRHASLATVGKPASS